ncbi:kinase D-interacting substrate of 220 kDa isoform X2 [Neocloeon triangulifer]|uniref:kinase D-interacting substrate of 220 kDa isoform X2 n=1 Tax=Neocloeon triangulifer TaxID=2078957 RepID=UPI00286F0CB3|nr:kinase D-interacting substrate of 220 kDa isoform X2 [Neocloeon triangulifer]
MASTSAKETLPIIQKHASTRSYGAVSTFYNFLAPAIASISGSSQTLASPDPVMAAIGHRTIVNLIVDDDLPGLQALLESRRVNVDDRDENGTTALQVAASRGKIEFVKELLNFGAEVNAEDLDNWSALLCAAKEGHTEVCNRLLDAGATLEHRDMGGWTALLWASYKGRTETAALLLARGADVHAQGNYNISSLIWAAGRGHSEIVRELLEHGAKAVTADKCGTSALVWACRNGNPDSVALLLKAGANVDAVGMYSWTALLVATSGGHTEAVALILKAKANINVKDKDGCTSLAVASKEGFEDIVNALLNEGAYINVQDRAGDTSLIHAVKGGHRPVVEALLKKYADADIPGKDHKTALYWAVEKGNAAIVKLLLSANPDLEVATKDGDTALMKAVRNRNSEIVQLLLDKKAKVTAADKKGDTCLHIAMRARSKGIVEVLLRNPKHSQLLYRPNKDGETPYNLDMKHSKTILGQMFGQRRLNSSSENEKLLGYDLYGTAIADTLSEPFLTMPIIVGLFAKWGSGKSFLLNKLKEEMKGFARQWVEPTFAFTPLLFLLVLHVALLLAVASYLAANSWIVGCSVGVGFFIGCYIVLLLIWYGAQRLDWYWPYNTSVALAYRLARIKLVLEVLFCHPAAQNRENTNANPIRFYFSDQAKLSTTAGRESSLLNMIGSLYDALEKDYGTWAPRLYRAFRPEPVRSSWQWRRLCCLPYCVLWHILFACGLLLAIGVGFWLRASADANIIETWTIQAAVITLGLVISVAVVANLFTVGRAFQSLVLSQKRQLLNAVSKSKGEGFIHQLRGEVSLLTNMVECLDSFSEQQTRLVAVIDGLDTAEQDKVLQILDAISILFNEAHAPFIVLLAIDPHIIARSLDSNTQRVFTDGPISGNLYVRNLVHLPFYLQNSAINRAKVAQQWAARRQDDSTVTVSRRLSSESSGGDRLKAPGNSRKGSSSTRRLWSSESVASSLASNLNRAGMGMEAGHKGFLLTDDYFSDVNPRSLRRLMNVMHITVRLLRSFQIEVSWYHVSIWINLAEQWPYRLSWMILYMEAFEEALDDTSSLRSVYEKVKPYVPASRDTEPLLEMDADEKKLEIFLANHRSNLLVCHMRLYLPFTINLDPYLKKVIKEENVGLEETFAAQAQQQDGPSVASKPPAILRRQRSSLRTVQTPQSQAVVYPQIPQQIPPQAQSILNWPNPWEPPVIIQQRPPLPLPNIQVNPEEAKLSGMSVDGFCDFLNSVDDLSPGTVTALQKSLKENNIGGKVLALCELNELKQVLNLNFGDWEIFKWLVMSLRQQEVNPVEEKSYVRFAPVQRKSSMSGKTGMAGDSKESKSRIDSRQKQTMLEKQVSMEEQMISKALRTLSEEATEDAMEEPGTPLLTTTNSPAQIDTPGSTRRLLRPSDKNKRPVSLLVAAPQDETVLFPDVSTPPASPRRISALRRAVVPSMTPASSLEKIRDRILRSKDNHDEPPLGADENTPLVSEVSSPVAIIPVTIASPPTLSSASSALSLSSHTPEQLDAKIKENGENLPETQV